MLGRLSRISIFRELVDFVSFKTRRRVILALIVSSIFGTFYWRIPATGRWWFFLLYLWLILLAIVSQGGFYLNLARSNIGTLLLGWRYKALPYSSPEIDALAAKMGLLRRVRVYTTGNPLIKSAFTNPYTAKVYVPAVWVASLSKSEMMGVLGHEFAHITQRNRVVLEGTLAMVLSYSFGWTLYFFTVMVLSTALLQLVFDVAPIAMSLFLVSFVSWRAEYRSDKEGAKVTGPEGLISLFERFERESDDGSETHPPPSMRIQRLEEML